MKFTISIFLKKEDLALQENFEGFNARARHRERRVQP